MIKKYALILLMILLSSVSMLVPQALASTGAIASVSLGRYFFKILIDGASTGNFPTLVAQGDLDPSFFKER